MRKYILPCLLLLFTSAVSAQTQLPSVRVSNLKGESLDTRSLLNDSIPVVLSFWSTICKPCIIELNAFADKLEDWQKEVNFKIVAVSTDDVRFTSKVRSLAAVNGWPFTVLLDKNQDFKRALNVNAIPHLYILDKTGKIVYSRIGYTPGSEAKVLEVLKGL